jgi:hypothetical protein
MTLTVNVPRDQFTAGAKTVNISGSFDNGQQQGGRSFRGPGMGKSVKGTVKLTKAGQKEGDPISGSLDVRIVELRGGMFGRR